MNSPLAVAYFLKEDLRKIWSQCCKSVARNVLFDWGKRARASGIPMLSKFANTLAAHAPAPYIAMTIQSQPTPWKGPITKSKPCKGKLMASKIWFSLN